MRPESRKLLWDALQAAERIGRFIANKHFEDYCADEQLRSAVERQFEIAGEALAQLSKFDPQTVARIPESPRIIAFRNALIHGYSTVDNQLVWGIVERNLPPFRAALEGLLG